MIDAGFPQKKLGHPHKTAKVQDIINCVREEVVATWQSFILNDFMPKAILKDVLHYVLTEIKKPATPGKPESQYGSLKHKPYRDLVSGKNVVRMPHEFAIGFRYGHSQLRPMYKLNSAAPYVLLFKDARLSKTVRVDLPKGYSVDHIDVDGSDDLHGHRPLMANHVIEWKVFYPLSNDLTTQVETHSLLIDHNITARVFNLPESAIPDDVKYIGNLVHRNLIRSSQIGIVSGEELAEFYGVDVLPHKFIIGNVDHETEKRLTPLFQLDGKSDHGHKPFKTPLWYYLLKEAEYYGAKDPKQLGKLGAVGSRLVAEVLAGAIYYGNEYSFSDQWKSFIPSVDNKVMLTDILKFVGDEAATPVGA